MRRLTKIFASKLQAKFLALKGEPEIADDELKNFLDEVDKVYKTNARTEKLVDKNFTIDKYFFKLIKEIVKDDNELIIRFQGEKPLIFSKYKILENERKFKNGIKHEFIELYFAELYYENGLFEAHLLINHPSARFQSGLNLFNFTILANDIKIGE